MTQRDRNEGRAAPQWAGEIVSSAERRGSFHHSVEPGENAGPGWPPEPPRNLSERRAVRQIPAIRSTGDGRSAGRTRGPVGRSAIGLIYVGSATGPGCRGPDKWTIDAQR